MDNKEPKANGEDQMIEGTEAVNSPKNVEAEPGHEASANVSGNAMDGVPPSGPAEEEEQCLNGGHSRQPQQKSTRSYWPRRQPTSFVDAREGVAMLCLKIRL